MVFRLSQKLGAKIKAGTLKTLPLDDNPFADWSANLFIADRTQCILLSNTESLYSTVLIGKGITDRSRFIDHALGSLREFMAGDGMDFVYARFVASASRMVSFAKALNRSVTGSMNDLIAHAKAWLIEEQVSPYEVGFRLNDIPLSAVAAGNFAKYGKPREAFKDTVSAGKQ